MTGIVARIEENLKGFRRNVQHKKCSLSSLLWPYKFSKSLAKDKNEFMLENSSLTSLHLSENERTCIFYISLAYSDMKEHFWLLYIVLFRTWRDELWPEKRALDVWNWLAMIDE